MPSPDVLSRAIWSVCRHGKPQDPSRVSCSQNKSLEEAGNTCCRSCCSRCAAAGKRILEEQLPMILSVVFIKTKKNPAPRFLNGSQKGESWTLGLLMCWNTAKMFSQQALRTQQLGSKVINQKFKQRLQSLERTQRFGDAKSKQSKTNSNWNVLQTFRVFCRVYGCSGIPVSCHMNSRQRWNAELWRGQHPPCHPRCRRSRCSPWQSCGQWRGSASPQSLLTLFPRSPGMGTTGQGQKPAEGESTVSEFIRPSS